MFKATNSNTDKTDVDYSCNACASQRETRSKLRCVTISTQVEGADECTVARINKIARLARDILRAAEQVKEEPVQGEPAKSKWSKKAGGPKKSERKKLSKQANVAKVSAGMDTLLRDLVAQVNRLLPQVDQPSETTTVDDQLRWNELCQANTLFSDLKIRAAVLAEQKMPTNIQAIFERVVGEIRRPKGREAPELGQLYGELQHDKRAAGIRFCGGQKSKGAMHRICESQAF